ncbi:MAG TPA: bifunctional DNA-formamidopyrimidine glycosylase/DNA-(apurinic or apyrimidinic site) lyase [Gemmatimonadaceae bacterium]|nr:bifunctional DNA-formamidopyrimidine glycosylase/DNA-(apurinic or apyrimidinic site) lyase [Gemmatimonadaceae bacterium]
MPELPETETIARDLDAAVAGRRVIAVRVRRADVLRRTTPRSLARRLRGARIVGAWRRAKLVILDLDTGDRLVVQPRFTGALLVDDGTLPERERRYATVSMTLDDARTLHYRDIRRLGTVTLMAPDEWSAYERALGIEPLDPRFTTARLWEIVHRSGQAVKKVVMDQRRLAGIGNIYANEALWRARIDPSRAARSLSHDEVHAMHDAITTVLREAVAARGTSFRDYRDASGRTGNFAAAVAVYGRGGEPCPRCGARLVDTAAVDGRTTVFCARCQR